MGTHGATRAGPEGTHRLGSPATGDGEQASLQREQKGPISGQIWLLPKTLLLANWEVAIPA